MQTKKCAHCKLDKSANEFHKATKHKDGLGSLCKLCKKIQDKKYVDENKERLKIQNKEYRDINADIIKEKKREYYKNNRERLRIYGENYRKDNKEIVKKRKAEYRQKTKKQRNEKEKLRRKTDKRYRINCIMSQSISKNLSKSKNCAAWKSLVDYTLDELILHLESKFLDGMSWDNYGKNGWHIDHVIPKSYFKFNNPEHPAFKAAWALSNLQPMWESDNLHKSNKIIITKEIQELLDSVNEVHTGSVKGSVEPKTIIGS